MHQGLTIPFLGYFPEMEPQFFLLLGLSCCSQRSGLLYLRWDVAYSHWNACFIPSLPVNRSNSHVVLITPWTLKMMLVQSGPRSSQRRRIKPLLRSLKRGGREASGTKNIFFLCLGHRDHCRLSNDKARRSSLLECYKQHHLFHGKRGIPLGWSVIS